MTFHSYIVAEPVCQCSAKRPWSYSEQHLQYPDTIVCFDFAQTWPCMTREGMTREGVCTLCCNNLLCLLSCSLLGFESICHVIQLTLKHVHVRAPTIGTQQLSTPLEARHGPVLCHGQDACIARGMFARALKVFGLRLKMTITMQATRATRTWSSSAHQAHLGCWRMHKDQPLQQPASAEDL